MGDPPRKRRSLVEAFLAALLVATLRSADAAVAGNEKAVAVVGAGECADCASRNIKDADVFQGLQVAINCKAGEGDYQVRGVGKLDKDGKFTVNLPSELLKEDGHLKAECYAQLRGGSKNAPCPSAAGALDAAKLVLKSRDGKGQHTFATAGGKLSFSSASCAAAWWWPHPWLKPVPKYPYPYPPKVYTPIYKPPLTPPVYQPPPTPPVYQPPPTPVYTPPPVYNPPPVYSPPPVYKPPVYSPPPVYKPPVYSPPPVYKPPVYSPPPVYKPPVYSPPPVYKPPPVYQPPAVYTPPPFYKPPCPPIYIYKPPIPKFPPFPPVYTKPWPTVPKFPPMYQKPPIPQLPPKYFYPHPKFWYPPSYGWPPKSASPTYTLPKHPFFPPSKVGKPQP